MSFQNFLGRLAFWKERPWTPPADAPIGRSMFLEVLHTGASEFLKFHGYENFSRSSLQKIPLEGTELSFFYKVMGRFYPTELYGDDVHVLLEAFMGYYLYSMNDSEKPSHDEAIKFAVHAVLLPFNREDFAAGFYTVSEARRIPKLCVKVIRSILDENTAPDDYLSLISQG